MSAEQNKLCKCRDCEYFYADDRITDYRREPCYFCRRKGAFFSRNYRVGEGTRINYEDDACKEYKEQKGHSNER